MRKLTQRRAVDYTSTVVRYMQVLLVYGLYKSCLLTWLLFTVLFNFLPLAAEVFIEKIVNASWQIGVVYMWFYLCRWLVKSMETEVEQVRLRFNSIKP